MNSYQGKVILRLRLLIIVLLMLFVACQGDQSKPSPTPTSTAQPTYHESSVTFLAVGDIMLSRGVTAKMNRANDPLLPFSKMDAILKSTDFNFANLETPISGKDQVTGKGLVFNTAVKNTVGLMAYNFKVLNLANNHAMDQGFKGLINTKQYLTENGLVSMGVGSNLEEAWQPAYYSVGDVKIAFIGTSYASVNDGGVHRNDYVARIEDQDKLKKAIATAREQADFVLVTMHAGIEYMRKPHQPQIDFAHAAIDFGADIVVGAHPHWIQIMEEYKHKYIFYSLGNFIFDQRDPETKEGLTLKISLQSKKQVGGTDHAQVVIKEIELIPIIIENYSVPRPANEAERTKILAKINLTDHILTPKK